VTDSPLDTIREARRVFREWLERMKKSPDPSSHAGEGFGDIAKQLQAVERALAGASTSLRASDDWKNEIAAYDSTLREVKARLANFEITLRIRGTQMNRKKEKLDAIRCWADLARNIG
jgi:hypothetical protein